MLGLKLNQVSERGQCSLNRAVKTLALLTWNIGSLPGRETFLFRLWICNITWKKTRIFMAQRKSIPSIFVHLYGDRTPLLIIIQYHTGAKNQYLVHLQAWHLNLKWYNIYFLFWFEHLSSIILCWVQFVDSSVYLDELKPEQNGRHFAYNIFKCIFPNETFVFWFTVD